MTDIGAENNGSKTRNLEKSVDRMTKSSDFNDFDSVMSQSVTSIGSDIVTPMKRNGVKAKIKNSPKKERNESPSRVAKNGEKESRTDSPSRYRKKTESPVARRKRERKESSEVKRQSRDVQDEKESSNSMPANRLSGSASNASNNIFYLIDPTVKNKCKSVGELAAEKRKSGNFTPSTEKDTQAESKTDASLSPKNRERTKSDPYKKSKVMEQTHL
ncbi:hypothetical protein MAR_028422 [Mya arenaria]|uniref:Uncharacterized protein n=1 Tax=Mya arenaria TaxID=6604 RepID=A0ABY7DGA9_MYAAR|nr:hypothetical protein MAR_028422 [Mya arenaria]